MKYFPRRKWKSIVEDDHLLIPLTQGKFAIIDPEDLDKIKSRAWQYRNPGKGTTGYAISSKIRMHRIIMNCKKGEEIDHKDGNGLNNRKSNLRFCNQSENMSNTGLKKTNTSGFKGVSFCKNYNNWDARITFNNRQICLGKFDTPEEAADAYIVKARELQGDFFPEQRIA